MPREIINVPQSEPDNRGNFPFKYIAFIILSILSLALVFDYELIKN